ncbi:50S ribosomal protein L4 [bacterium]|nr:50S ribosomal protein L4 [bacterium]
MKVEVRTIKGEDTGRKVDLPKDIFGIEPNDHAVYLAVVAERSNKRHGTHSTLERSTVSGSTKKPWKQKGTGGARAGSVKTPLWPGGAITFGPHPHLYKKDVNTKVKRIARKSALTYKAADNKIMIVEDFHTICADLPKTKEVFGVLSSLGLQHGVKAESSKAKGRKKKSEESVEETAKKSKRINKVLMLVDKVHAVKDEKDARAYENFRKSCRNIPGLKVSVVKDASTYDIMNADYLLFHESAIKTVETVFGSPN